MIIAIVYDGKWHFFTFPEIQFQNIPLETKCLSYQHAFGTEIASSLGRKKHLR